MNVTWPDIIIGLILLIGALRGFSRGFVMELTGALALAGAVVAAFLYPGIWDKPLGDATHLGPGSAHVVSMIVFGAIAYGAISYAGRLLSRIARLPVIGLFNSALGAVVGLAWSAFFVWLVIFIALWFPLSKDLRADLHKSYLVSFFQQPNGEIDTFIKKSLPWFAKPFSNGIFGRHRV